VAKSKKSSAVKAKAKAKPAAKAGAKPKAKLKAKPAVAKKSAPVKGKAKAKAKKTSSVKVAAKKTPIAKASKAAKSAASKVKAAPQKAKVTAKPALKLVNGKKSAGSSAGQKNGFKWGDFLTPLDDRILIEQAPAEERTVGGLYIPDTVQDKPTRGKVVAVGRGRRNKKGMIRPLDVQLGDQVLYGKYAGTPLQLAGQDVVLLREDDVIAIVK
jgi:chaperonin GroES